MVQDMGLGSSMPGRGARNRYPQDEVHVQREV